MKLRFSLLLSALCFCLPTLANAQSARDVEMSAYHLCSEMLGTDREAEACTDWIATGTCATTYRKRIADVAKLTSTDALLRYQINAEKALPATCEAYAALDLNFDILHSLSDEAQILKRWDRMMYWAARLQPEQAFIALNRMLQESGIEEIIKRPAVKKFVQSTLALIDDQLDNVSRELVGSLVQLDRLDETLVVGAAQAVLLAHEIRMQKNTSARRRLLALDLPSQSEKVRNYLQPRIEGAIPQLFGTPDFKNSVCYPEVSSTSKSPAYRLFEYLATRNSALFILEQLVVQQLFHCDFEGAVSSVMSNYPRTRHTSDMDRLMHAVIDYAESTHHRRLITALVQQVLSLDNSSQAEFVRRYGNQLSRLALDAGRDAVESCDTNSAQLLLNSLDRIAPPPMLPEIQMLKGRFLALQKNGALARANWDQIIQKMRRGDIAERAYYLTMMSLARDGKWQDADAMLKEFRESFQDSIWLARLPDTFKGYKVPAISCK